MEKVIFQVSLDLKVLSAEKCDTKVSKSQFPDNTTKNTKHLKMSP
jgi:hypothetical protein